MQSRQAHSTNIISGTAECESLVAHTFSMVTVLFDTSHFVTSSFDTSWFNQGVNSFTYLIHDLIWYICHIHLFNRNIWTHNWLAPNISGFIVSWLEYCSGIARSQVYIQLKPWIFSGFSHSCINCIHNYKDHSSFDTNYTYLLYSFTAWVCIEFVLKQLCIVKTGFHFYHVVAVTTSQNEKVLSLSD